MILQKNKALVLFFLVSLLISPIAISEITDGCLGNVTIDNNITTCEKTAEGSTVSILFENFDPVTTYFDIIPEKTQFNSILEENAITLLVEVPSFKESEEISVTFIKDQNIVDKYILKIEPEKKFVIDCKEEITLFKGLEKTITADIFKKDLNIIVDYDNTYIHGNLINENITQSMTPFLTDIDLITIQAKSDISVDLLPLTTPLTIIATEVNNPEKQYTCETSLLIPKDDSVPKTTPTPDIDSDFVTTLTITPQRVRYKFGANITAKVIFLEALNKQINAGVNEHNIVITEFKKNNEVKSLSSTHMPKKDDVFQLSLYLPQEGNFSLQIIDNITKTPLTKSIDIEVYIPPKPKEIEISFKTLKDTYLLENTVVQGNFDFLNVRGELIPFYITHESGEKVISNKTDYIADNTSTVFSLDTYRIKSTQAGDNNVCIYVHNAKKCQSFYIIKTVDQSLKLTGEANLKGFIDETFSFTFSMIADNITKLEGLSTVPERYFSVKSINKCEFDAEFQKTRGLKSWTIDKIDTIKGQNVLIKLKSQKMKTCIFKFILSCETGCKEKSVESKITLISMSALTDSQLKMKNIDKKIGIIKESEVVHEDFLNIERFNNKLTGVPGMFVAFGLGAALAAIVGFLFLFSAGGGRS